jgi:alpha-galactosidase
VAASAAAELPGFRVRAVRRQDQGDAAHAGRPSVTTGLAGPKRIGLRPGHPFIYRLPVADEDLVDAVDGLPPGLTIDATRRVISGATIAAGRHSVTISADGPSGRWRDRLDLLVGPDICLTPPLGWNSWNVHGPAVTEEDVRRAATTVIDSGLAASGWSTINIDDGWQGSRDRSGKLQPNDRFRDITSLCADLHALGLRIGTYSSPGPTTCARYVGSAGHEIEDAASFATWGFDYLKYDWCSAGPIDDSTPLADLTAPYQRMRDALDRTDRDIVFHVCQYGFGQVWRWARERVGANAWRTTGDIEDSWASVDRIGFGQADLAAFAGPGGWNDPDMLVIGAVGGAWGRPIRLAPLSSVEQRTHVELWVMLAAPLLLGCDLSLLDEPTLDLLRNRELLAIHQDQLGRQASRWRSDEGIEIWRRPLADRAEAIAVFNRRDEPAAVPIEWAELGLIARDVRDVSARRSIEALNGWDAVLEPHGSVVLRVS